MTQIYRTFEPLPLNSSLTLRFSPKLPSSHGHSTTLLYPYLSSKPMLVALCDAETI